jgi:hypothetical protein
VKAVRASVLLLVVSSCAGPLAPLLRWDARPAVEAREGRVAVGAVTLSRKDDHGGNDGALAGQVRTLTGVPVEVRIDGPMTQTSRVEWAPEALETTFKRLTTEALAAAGLAVASDGSGAQPTARVEIEVTELGVEGYMTMNSVVGLTVTVVNPQTKKLRSRFFTRQEGSAKDSENLPMFAAMNAYDVTPACKIGEFTVACLALQRALSATMGNLVLGFSQQETRTALLGADPVPPEPPAPVPAAPALVCEPDCSPGYVCLRGTCVSACNPLCAENERCGADRSCHPRAAP